MGPVARAFHSFTDWFRRRLRRLMRRNRRAIAVDLIQADPMKALSSSCEPEKVDWSRRDVLVGSFRSREQFYDNLGRNYYYFPAAFLEGDIETIQYIALYQSQRFFRGEAGIRYFGKVTQAKRVFRDEIDFPGNPELSNESYYIFTVDRWQELEETISVRDEGVYAPRKTHFVLLQNCSQSFELFHIRSEMDLRLMMAVNRARDDLTAASRRKTAVYPVGDTHFVAVAGKALMLTDKKGNILDRITVNSFARNPRAGFLSFKRHMI